MKKKASIVTYCNNGKTNYGQILQAYAMVKLLEEKGYKAKVVRYRKLEKKEKKYGMLLRGIYEVFNEYRIEPIIFWPRRFLFQFFLIREIPHTFVCYDVNEVESKSKRSDILICGSDQIWNPKAYDPVYYLKFGAENQKRYALAPSIGIASEKGFEEEIKKMVKSIEKLNEVYLREKIAAELISRYTDKPIFFMLDPTMMIPVKIWDKFAGKRKITEDYIFCYFLGDMNRYKAQIRKIAKEKNCKIVCVTTSENRKISNDFGRAIYSVSPEKFLSLIKYSQNVCTDSFHGVAFSIIFGKEISIFKRSQLNIWGNFSRISNIINETQYTKYVIFDEYNGEENICL